MSVGRIVVVMVLSIVVDLVGAMIVMVLSVILSAMYKVTIFLVKTTVHFLQCWLPQRPQLPIASLTSPLKAQLTQLLTALLTALY